MTEFEPTQVGPYYRGSLLRPAATRDNGGVQHHCSCRLRGQWDDANGWSVQLGRRQPPTSCDFDSMGISPRRWRPLAGYDTLGNEYQICSITLPSIGARGLGGARLRRLGHARSNGYNAPWVSGHRTRPQLRPAACGSVGCGAQVLGGSWRRFVSMAIHSTRRARFARCVSTRCKKAEAEPGFRRRRSRSPHRREPRRTSLRHWKPAVGSNLARDRDPWPAPADAHLLELSFASPTRLR